MVRNQLPAQVVNLLRLNDVLRTSRIFCLKITIFPRYIYLGIFKYNPGETNNKFILNNFYSVYRFNIPMSSKRKRRIIVYGSVTRYGPQSVASASLHSGPD